METATEQLSEYLERDISAENLVDIKQKVQDKYRWVCVTINSKRLRTDEVLFFFVCAPNIFYVLNIFQSIEIFL